MANIFLYDIAQYINKTIEKKCNPSFRHFRGWHWYSGAIRNDGAVNKCVNLGWGVVHVADELSKMINVSKRLYSYSK